MTGLSYQRHRPKIKSWSRTVEERLQCAAPKPNPKTAWDSTGTDALVRPAGTLTCLAGPTKAKMPRDARITKAIVPVPIVPPPTQAMTIQNLAGYEGLSNVQIIAHQQKRANKNITVMFVMSSAPSHAQSGRPIDACHVA